MTAEAPRYSLGEEIAHSVTHGIGVILSIAGLVILVTLAALRGNAWHVVSSSIFGVTLIFLYTASTLYHSITHPGTKKVLRVFDHSAIFLLIAGTYTPFTLVTLRGGWGWTLFVLIWGLALVGIVYKITASKRYRLLSVLLYLGMGWLVLVAIKPMVTSVPLPGLVLLLAGGLCYTLGLVFFVWRSLPYSHAVWHVFVLAGSICHFFAILLYVIPRPS
jgi:hemolysin III